MDHSQTGLNFWPGFVDALSNVILVMVFIVVVFAFTLYSAFLKILNNQDAVEEKTEQSVGKAASADLANQQLQEQLDQALEKLEQQSKSLAAIAQASPQEQQQMAAEAQNQAQQALEKLNEAEKALAQEKQKVLEQEKALEQERQRLEQEKQAKAEMQAALDQAIKEKQEQQAQAQQKLEAAEKSLVAAKQALEKEQNKTPAATTPEQIKQLQAQLEKANQELEKAKKEQVKSKTAEQAARKQLAQLRSENIKKDEKLEVNQQTKANTEKTNDGLPGFAVAQQSGGRIVIDFGPSVVTLDDKSIAQLEKVLVPLLQGAKGVEMRGIWGAQSYSEGRRLAFFRIAAVRNFLVSKKVDPKTIKSGLADMPNIALGSRGQVVLVVMK